MCGIAGVIAWDDRYRVDRATLQRMSARIAHRGPDGEGYYLNHEQEVTPDRPQCGFAFRRLAILDPDPRAMQPFTIGGKTIVFNGEIYNFRELCAGLTTLRPEYAWRTSGDTEVLLLAYDVWGEKCLERLNGMFAFAVWDDVEKRLFLARDRIGQKPLYFATMPIQAKGAGWAALAFASEPRALRDLSWISHDYLPSSLLSYLRFGSVAEPFTIFDGINKLMAGMFATCRVEESFRGARLVAGRYFSAGNPQGTNRAGDAAEFRRRVTTAVARQLISDVPLGVFLSGGIDSSVVTACARKFGPVDTFSISFDDSRYDESHFAREVAKHVGTRHHEFRVTANAIEDLPTLASVFGEPFADSSAVPTHYLSRETRKRVKVALSGDGGDELFGGYDRYLAMRLSSRVKLRLAKTVAATVARRWTSGHPKSRVTRAARFLSSLDVDAAKRYDGYMRVFDDPTVAQLMPGDPGSPSSAVEETFRGELERTGDVVRAAVATDRATYLPNDLLTKVDRASMLHGLEVRSPFMDHELVQFAAGLTADQLLKGGPKRMLREAFADDLPAWVFKRKKMGFAVPIGEWFRGELRPMLRDHLFAGDSFAKQNFTMKVVERLVEEHEAQRVDHSQRLYALLMLELWWKTQRIE